MPEWLELSTTAKFVTSNRVYNVTRFFKSIYGHHPHIIVKNKLFQTNEKTPQYTIHFLSSNDV